MRITDINTTKRGRFSVFVDGGFYGVLHSMVYASSGLSAGSEIGQAQLDALIEESSLIIAREKALSLLSARSYTERGLYDKLLAFTDEESAWQAIQRMKELGLLDDLDYARRYAADCINLKHYSAFHTRQALRQKGIAPEVIDEAMTAFDQQDPEPLIARVITRKYLRYIYTEAGQRKTIEAMRRKGFKWRDIQSVINNLIDDSEYYSISEQED